MNNQILKKIFKLEEKTKHDHLPLVVFINKDESGRYKVMEQYDKYTKKFMIDSVDEYQIPKGFKGAVYVGEEEIE